MPVAGLIIQLLVGSKILDVDTNVKADRDLMWVLGLLLVVGLPWSHKLPRVATFRSADRPLHRPS